jgi:hypothetical protein
MNKFLLLLLLPIFVSFQLNAATYYLTTTNQNAAQTLANWNTTGTGGGTTHPSNFTTSGDIFIISTGQTANFAANPNFGSGVTLQINSGSTMNIGGNNTSFTMNGTVVFGSTNSTQVTMDGGGSGNTFTLSSGATLKTVNTNGIQGTNCSLPANASKKTVVLNTAANYELNGTSAQLTLGLPATVSILTINNAAGVTLSADVTVTTLNIGNVTSNSIFDDGGSQVTSTGTLNLTSGTFSLGGAASTTWPAFATRNISAGTTVEYGSAVAQTVSITPAYQNLTFSGAGTKTVASGTLSVGGNWSVTGGTAALNTNNSSVTVTGNITSGNITSGSGTISIGGSWTNSGTFTCGTGTVNFTGAAQTIPSLTYNILTLSGSGTKTAGGNLTAATLNNTVGDILDMIGFTLTATTINNGASTIKFNGASNGKAISTGTVEYYGATQTVATGTYSTLTLSASGTKTAGGNLTATTLNNLNSSVLDMAGNTLNVSGTITNTASTIKFNGTSNGKAISSGTVEYYGTTQTVATGTYSTLTLSASGTKTAGGNLTATTLNNLNGSVLDMVGNTLTVSGTTTNTASTIKFNGASNGLSVSTGTVEYYGTTQTVATGTYSTLTLSASGTKTAGGNLIAATLNNLNGSVLDMVGNTLTVSGTTTNTASTIKFNGASNGKAISTGTVEYYGATQTVATGTYSTLTLSASGTKTAGGNLIVATLNNLNGSVLDMVGNTLTVSGTTTNTASTIKFNGASNGKAISTGTVEYYGTTQTVATGTYAILTLSASGTKTAGGSLTVTTLNNLNGSVLDMAGNTLSVSGITTNTASTIKFNGASNGKAISTGTVEYYGIAQTVATGSYSALTLSGSGAKTTAGVTVTGILSMEGSATASAAPTYVGSAILQYKGSVAQVTGPEFPATAPSGVIIVNSNGVTLDAGKTISVLTIQSNGVFSDGGFAISPATTLNMNSGVYNCNVSLFPWTTANLTGGTVNYNYAGPQTLPAQTYSNLTVSGSGTKTLGGPITVNGALSINPGNSGATLDANSQIITIVGPGLAWNNPNNSFTYGTSTVKMQGTLAQSMVGSTFYNLEINNPAGVTLSTSDIITNQLKLTSGQLILNGNILTMNSGAVIAGNGGNALSNFNNSNSNYIVTGSGDYVRQNVASSDVIYPVGTASSFTPAILNNTGGTPDNYGVYVVTSTAHTADFAGVVDKQWTVQEESAGLSNLIMTFQWNAPSNEGTLFQPATTASVGIWGGVLGPNMDVVDNNLTIHGSNPRWVKMNQWQDMDFAGGNARTYAVGNNDALPVELSSFTSIVNGRNINLSWETKTEKNSNIFTIERTKVGNAELNWVSVGSVKAAVLSNSPKQYLYLDKNLQAGKYQYRLKMIDNDGSFAFSKIVEAEVTVPKNFELSQNYPNPFNPATKINYSLPNDSKVTLEVYNIIGERVAQLVNEAQSAGYYTVNFGTSYNSITSGVYIYKLTAVDNSGNNFSSIKKMMLLK